MRQKKREILHSYLEKILWTSYRAFGKTRFLKRDIHNTYENWISLTCLGDTSLHNWYSMKLRIYSILRDPYGVLEWSTLTLNDFEKTFHRIPLESATKVLVDVQIQNQVFMIITLYPPSSTHNGRWLRSNFSRSWEVFPEEDLCALLISKQLLFPWHLR